MIRRSECPALMVEIDSFSYVDCGQYGIQRFLVIDDDASALSPGLTSPLYLCEITLSRERSDIYLVTFGLSNVINDIFNHRKLSIIGKTEETLIINLLLAVL